MQNIKINRYSNPAQVGFSASISPEDNSWHLFVSTDGKPMLFTKDDLEDTSEE